jgi:uncharacterized membrane protein
MNAAHIHLLFTHLPIIGLAFVMLVNLVALLRKNEELQKLTLWLYLLLGIFALLAYLTGDGAEEIMMSYPGITEKIIEPHETFAIIFFIGLMVTTALSMAGLYVTKTKKELLPRFNLWFIIAAMLISFFAVKTGSTGGSIRHTEIKEGAWKKAN